MASTVSFPSFLLQVVTILSLAQSVLAVSSTSSLSEATRTSELDLEDERAACFQKCYTQYGNFENCPFGENMVTACWCSEKDWVEREEDCVWDVCGVDAYNDYANVLKRICQTVAIPSSGPFATTSSTSENDSIQKTVLSTRTSDHQPSQTITTSRNTEIRTDAPSTAVSSTSTTNEKAAEESDHSNTGIAVGWTSSFATGILVCVAYLMRMIL